jgi:hypothetical protein
MYSDIAIPTWHLTVRGIKVGPDEALTITIKRGSAIVYGAGVDNSGQGLTFQIA